MTRELRDHLVVMDYPACEDSKERVVHQVLPVAVVLLAPR